MQTDQKILPIEKKVHFATSENKKNFIMMTQFSHHDVRNN